MDQTMIDGRRDEMRGETMTDEMRVGMIEGMRDEVSEWMAGVMTGGMIDEVRGGAAMGRSWKDGILIDGMVMGRTITGRTRIGEMVMGGGTTDERHSTHT
jgi:hypothetical protein